MLQFQTFPKIYLEYARDSKDWIISNVNSFLGLLLKWIQEVHRNVDINTRDCRVSKLRELLSEKLLPWKAKNFYKITRRLRQADKSVLFPLIVELFAALRIAASARVRILSVISSPFHPNLYSIVHSVSAFQLAFSNPFVSRTEPWNFVAFRIRRFLYIFETPVGLYILSFLLGVCGFNY
jgi:hypothetical protein